MAKLVSLVAAFCILAVVAHGHEQNKETFHVEGDVYCDPCRVSFETLLSQRITGATVRLECRCKDTGALTYSVEGLTGFNGHYSLKVEGDHENDICDIILVKSPREDCSEPMPGFANARVLCTRNTGMTSDVRFANPIGFLTKFVNSQCVPLLSEMGILLE